MTLKEQTKQKIKDTKELILQMIPTRTSELINDTDYNYGYLDSNLILHLLNVNATLSSSQTIVSDGSTMTINALVTDSDGNTVSNAPVQFYINGTASGNPINTDSNGIATYTYSGTGTGKVKVYAKVGTFLSETFSIWDTLFHDEGTSEPPENTWINSNFTVSYSNNGCLLTASQSFCTYFANMSGTGTSLFDWNTPFVVQFDVVSHVNGEIQLYDGTTNCTRSFNELGVTSNKTVKIVNDGTTIKYYVDGTEVTDKKFTATLGNCRVGFRVNSNNLGSIVFKNFRMYNG